MTLNIFKNYENYKPIWPRMKKAGYYKQHVDSGIIYNHYYLQTNMKCSEILSTLNTNSTIALREV